MSVAANYAAVRRRIAAACVRAGRAEADVRLVAVTKYADAEAVRELLSLGHRDLGEGRPQQLVERAGTFAGSGVRWHLIGPLQRNKARRTLPAATLIHSADDVRLLESLDRLAGELGLRPRVLVEVNVAEEPTKQGFEPDDLRDCWPAVAAMTRLDVAGLMTMAPSSDDPESVRPVFRGLRELRDELAAAGPFPLPDLSMGMTGDFEVAIEEGATLVRIGSAIFGEQ